MDGIGVSLCFKVFNLDNFYLFSWSIHEQVTALEKPQMKIISFQHYKHWYLNHTWSDTFRVMSWIGIGIYCMEGQLKSRFQSLCFKVQHIMMGFLKILRKFFILTGELFLLRYFMFTPPFGFSHSGTSYLPPPLDFPLRYFIFTPLLWDFSPEVLHIHPPPLGFFTIIIIVKRPMAADWPIWLNLAPYGESCCRIGLYSVVDYLSVWQWLCYLHFYEGNTFL